MPRGTLWAICAILQFINRIIVTLHFFVGSKLFYFFRIFEFWLQNVNQGGRFSGGRYCQKLSNFNRGPGGALCPPGLWHPWMTSGATKIVKTCGEHNLLSNLWVLVGHLSPFLNFCEKNEISPKMTEKRKNTKIVKIRSYSQGRLG